MNTLSLTKRIIKKQAGRFVCLLVMIVFGCCAITVTGLFVRSIKQTELNDNLDITGDYEVIIYNSDPSFKDVLLTSGYIDAIGMYYELGTVTDSLDTQAFKAIAFEDDESTEIYHQSCIRGAYPSNENEIAIDVTVANVYGIPSVPGETITLNMYDENGEYMGSHEFIVSGIFRASNKDVVGGWCRYAEFIISGVDYQMPAVVFHSSVAQQRGSQNSVLFVQSSSYAALDLSVIIKQLAGSSGHNGSLVLANQRGRYVYSWSLGLDEEVFSEEYAGYSRENVSESISKGTFNMDIFSSIIFPIILVLVIATEVVSLYTISKNIIADRKDYYAVLRSVGMSSKKVITNLIAEMAIFGFFGASLGSGLGIILHIALLNTFNKAMYLRLANGLTVEKTVRFVTFDPVVMSFAVCLVSLALSLAIPLYRLFKTYPSELLASSDDMFVGNKHIFTKNRSGYKTGWLSLLNRRINLHDGVTMFVLAIVLSTMLLGYTYFNAYSDLQTNWDQFFMESLGVGDNGYTVTLPETLTAKQYNVYNRHDAGIVPTFPEAVENNPYIERSWAAMMNRSTRMIFDEEPDDEMKMLLGQRMLNIRPGSFYLGTPTMLEAEMNAEDVIFEHLGYDPDVVMYELPTVGLTEHELTGLEPEIIAGCIDLDMIRTGQQVVLAVPEELADICLRCYPVGSDISIDDILLNEEEEQTSGVFDEINPDWIVYEQVLTFEDGSEYTMKRGSIGHKFTFETTVGAIVVLHDPVDMSMYLTHDINGVEYIQDEETGEPVEHFIYGMSILCLPASFESWGLPDRNFTSVKATLKDNVDIYEFDSFWYRSLKGSVAVETVSTFDYVDVIKITNERVMVVFYFLIVALILLGMVSVITGLYTKTRSRLGRFQTLRRIGLSVNQASLMIYTQNMFYPLMATAISIIPVYLIQHIFNQINEKISSGEIYTGSNARQWYDQIPYWTNLFSYNFVPALICCFLIGVLLIVAGTLPQILYLRKMKMIETREE